MESVELENIAGWMEFALILIVLLIAMWVERKTPDEEKPKTNTTIGPKYNIYVGEKHYLGTDNRNIAIDVYYKYCQNTDRQVRLFEGGTVIKERKEL